MRRLCIAASVVYATKLLKAKYRILQRHEPFIYDPIKNVSTHKFPIGILPQFLCIARFIVRAIVRPRKKTTFSIGISSREEEKKRATVAVIVIVVAFIVSTFLSSRFSAIQRTEHTTKINRHQRVFNVHLCFR